MSRSVLAVCAFLTFFSLIPACQDDSTGPECEDGLVMCPDGECRECCEDADCESGLFCCADGTCHHCCEDEDCATGETCCEDHTCCECCEDMDCADELYCNGEETCVEGSCVEGTQVDCNDDIECTVDACSEESQDCENTPDDELCPSGERCEPEQGGCIPDECEDDEDCTAGWHCCSDWSCQECCNDEQCRSDEFCNENRECELRCLEESEPCATEPDRCCPGLVCDLFTDNCMIACESDADCQARDDVPHAEDLHCQDGLCDYIHCTSDDDCPPGTACHQSNCLAIPGCEEIESCQISPPTASVHQGNSVRLIAAAYLAGGEVAWGISFVWSSDDDSVASVNSTGLVTGGDSEGSTYISATVDGCEISCQARVTNHVNSQTGKTRVMVADELDGSPIEGATVVVGAEAPAVTDAGGMAEFDVELSGADPADITASKADYHYVTIREVESTDVIVHMGKIYHLDENDTEVAGGIQGALNLDKIRCEPGHTCDVSLGMGGLSIPGSLTNVNPRRVLGETIMTPVNLGGAPIDVGFPEGLVIGLNMSWFKELYTPTGIDGTRIAWATGGKMDLADLIEVLGPALYTGDLYDFYVAILSVLGDAMSHTACKHRVAVSAIPRIPDDDDLNGNGSTDDLIPDYYEFPVHDMTVVSPAEHSMIFEAPSLPVGTYDVVLLISGVIVPGTGLVPLGISAGTDVTDTYDSPDGEISEPIVLYSSDGSDVIAGGDAQRVVLAMAFNLRSLADPEWHRLRLGGRIIFVDEFEGEHVLPPFMEPADVTYDADSRHMDVSGTPPGADCFQAVFATDSGKKWNIWSEHAASFDLPPAPPEGDRSESHGFVSIYLGSTTYQELVEFNSTNLADLALIVEAFSYVEMR